MTLRFLVMGGLICSSGFGFSVGYVCTEKLKELIGFSFHYVYIKKLKESDGLWISIERIDLYWEIESVYC